MELVWQTDSIMGFDLIGLKITDLIGFKPIISKTPERGD